MLWLATVNNLLLTSSYSYISKPVALFSMNVKVLHDSCVYNLVLHGSDFIILLFLTSSKLSFIYLWTRS